MVVLRSLFSMLIINSLCCDAATPWQVGLQEPATPTGEGIIHFHSDLMFLLVFVVVFVTWMLIRVVILFDSSKGYVPSDVVHNTLIEVIWTIMPAVSLIVIATPSFALLYSIDEAVEPSLTLKVIGHQWYWTYEYADYLNGDNEFINFESYILPEDEVPFGHLRLLEVDNRVMLPIKTHIRVIVISSDVLHCWAIPSFGVKIDACPGRLNEISLFIQRPGVFYGQCSEICGVNHGFMPIVIKVVSKYDFKLWQVGKLMSFDI